jgi:hypothetical protein
MPARFRDPAAGVVLAPSFFILDRVLMGASSRA